MEVTTTAKSNDESISKKAEFEDSNGSMTGEVPIQSFEYGDSIYAKLQRLAGKLNIEQRGIERVPENERTDTSYWNITSMWLAANTVIPSFTIGILGKALFNVGFIDGLLTVLFFNALGVTTVCFFSCFGPRFGLRQMVLTRLWFGWYGGKLIAVFNMIASIGWAAANVIVGAQLIHAANNSVPGWVGVIIIALCTLFVTLFGYKVIHAYERWSWIPNLIVFLIILGVFTHTGDFTKTPLRSGASEVGSILSFGSTIYGFATGYTPFAADYTVYQPRNRSKKIVFLVTWLGMLPPLLFTEMLGVALMQGTNLNGGDNIYQKGYEHSGAGGLVGAVLLPHLGTFGKFCMVVLALSIVANNCPNIYSVSLTLLVLGRWTQKIPRFAWTVLASLAYIAIAIPGYSHFESVLENFMNFIAYWLAIYEGISLTDHFVFKRGFSGYQPEFYNQPKKLPPGFAAVAAFGVGIIGMILGMSQAWWIGPIAKHAGTPPFGGDLGFEMGFVFSAISYIGFRTIEIKVYGR